jgi:hypothetical protein
MLAQEVAGGLEIHQMRDDTGVATWTELVTIGERLPGVEVSTSYGRPALKVRGKFMCALREDPDAFVFRVEDVADQQALIAGRPEVFFITPHYDGYPAVLAHPEAIGLDQLEELVEDAWRLRATKKLIAEHDGR